MWREGLRNTSGAIYRLGRTPHPNPDRDPSLPPLNILKATHYKGDVCEGVIFKDIWHHAPDIICGRKMCFGLFGVYTRRYGVQNDHRNSNIH